MNDFRHLQELSDYYLSRDIPENLSDIIQKELGLNIKANYGDFVLRNCLLVAPGQMTTSFQQIQMIKKSGFAGCVLKSVIAEDSTGRCSMIKFRRKPTYVKTVYDSQDIEGIFPIIHWDGGLDIRNLDDYIKFADSAVKLISDNFLIAASILGHLPSMDENFIEEEWIYTTQKLCNLGYKVFEVDFCPFLKEEDQLMNKKTILRWYEYVPLIMKKACKNIQIFPKIMNLDYGMDFQIKMIEASIVGGADGVIIGNRIYRKEYGCAHGGRSLRERNLQQIKIIKDKHSEIHISGTGGIYTGRHIMDYIKSGAENIQVLSYLMGKVKKPFIKKGNRFQQVFYQLMFDIEDGFLACLLKQRRYYENS